MRGIARAAGVDPSLIVHFFGCKAGLFGAVVQFPYDPGEALESILAGGADQVGQRLAQHFVDHWEHPEQRDPILSLMQVAFTDPTAAALVREFITVRVLVPLMRQISVDRPELRAGLLASQIGGFGIGRYVLAYDGLTKTPIDDVVAAFGWSLQMTCTGPLSPNVSPV
jgi:AcrR family transcriptional regulator